MDGIIIILDNEEKNNSKQSKIYIDGKKDKEGKGREGVYLRGECPKKKAL